MTCRGIDRLGHSCRRPVTPAVIWRAQERPAFHHSAWNCNVRLTRINTLFARASTRIDAAAATVLNFAVLLIPVRGPLPNISGHLIKSVSVCSERADRRCPLKSILTKVLVGEISLPRVRHGLSVGLKLITPHELSSFQ